MSNWILYDDFVEMVRDRHRGAFSGLITGLSDDNHSFQIGFDRGQIVLLSYRIKKGMAALHLITQIDRAKISEHPNGDIIKTQGEILDTSMVLSQLTAHTLDETTSITTDINSQPAPKKASNKSTKRPFDAKLKRTIESAAVHHFGPIAALVCEECLANPRGDPRTAMLEIAREVGANESDTRAFFHSVSGI